VSASRFSATADVGRARERRVGVAAHAGECKREIAAGFLEQQDVVSAGGGRVHHRRQGLDVEGDRLERILGGGGALCQHDRHGFADIADFVAGDDGLLEWFESRRRFLPQRNGRDRDADIGGGDDGVQRGRARAAPASIERMRPCATALRTITACSRSSRARSSTN
jgi:hypothetical protein